MRKAATKASAALGNPWAGKKWAALGTSITFEEYYSAPLATLLGATLTNLGVSGGTLATGGSGGVQGGIYEAVSDVPADADLITIECGINDFRTNVPLGSLGDTEATSFYGGLHRTLSDLFGVDPGRTVVFFTPYGNTDATFAGTYLTPNDNGVRIERFVQAIFDVAALFPNTYVVDVFGKSGIGGITADVFLRDGIHLNTRGGVVYANFVGLRLRKFAPKGMRRVQTPSMSPAGGSYGSTQNVTLACGTSGASIYYTTDGSTPSASSTLYTSAIAVSGDTTIKAIAVKAGMIDSAVRSEIYSFASASTLDPAHAGTHAVLTNGDRDIAADSVTWTTARGTQGRSAGKLYFEVEIVTLDNQTSFLVGFVDGTTDTAAGLDTYLGSITKSFGRWTLGALFGGGWGGTAPPGFTAAAGDVVMVAVNFDNAQAFFGLNGTWASDPLGGTANLQFTIGETIYPAISSAHPGTKLRLRSGAGQQTYSPPSGFSAWG